ncbi:MAG: hypothetical protein ACYCOU_12845 [Sulfobacillus sp.]
MGVTDEELVEMVSVIDFFSGTNALTSGLKIEFEWPKETLDKDPGLGR